MPSSDDLLFAEHVVKAGFLTQEEVDESFSVQRRMAEMGVQDSLRNVLVKRGALREGDAAIVARSAGLRSGGEPIPGYALEARLGSGAMGSVYKAWQKGMKRHVAIKILRRDLTDDPRQVERLQREAALVGKLDHPNIVRGLDSGETDGLVWFVMELVEGETLRERIARLGRIDPVEAVRITRQLAEALDHAAANGIVHRDVKPGNILLGREGPPRLTDYGLAKGETDDALTQLDATLGTPQYISPEQARNPRDADIRSDIYSLGATLYAMLAGKPPFAGETMAATLTKVLYERPKPLAEVAPAAPPGLSYVVERMMAKDRRHRYQTPAELLRDLRALEAGKLVVPAGFKGDIGEFVETRRHRRLWAAGAALVVVGVALAAGVREWERRGAEEKRRGEAGQALLSLRELAGPPDGWDGETVEKMLSGLDRIGRDYAGTPAAEDAIADVKHWAAEEAVIRRAQDLSRRAGEPPVDWPRIAAEIARGIDETRDQPDATVGRRKLVALLADVRGRRGEHAAKEIEKTNLAAAELPLDQAAARYASLADMLKTKYFGDETSGAVDAARTTEAKFREAATLLDRRFEEYDRASSKDGGLANGDYRALVAMLDRVAATAQQDERLAGLLGSLPPAGTRAGAVAQRRAVLLARIEKASAAAWEKTRRDADDAKARRDYDGAATTLAAFEARALDVERDEASAMRREILRVHDDAAWQARTLTDKSADRFWEAFGRRDYVRARETIDELAPVVTAAGAASASATEFMDGARRLLALVEKHATGPLLARLAKGGPLDRGIHLRSRQGGYVGYQGVRDVRVDGRTLTFTLDVGPTVTTSLDDLMLDDVVYYAGLAPSDAEHALVLAAMRLTEYRAPFDPTDGLKTLGDVRPLLDAARESAEFAPIAARLSKLREYLADAARAEIADAERNAKTIHEGAQQALLQGHGEEAFEKLRSLLEVPRYVRTDYVQRNRAEIAKEQKEAALRRRESNNAARFPGALFTQSADGSAELFFDFESPLLATTEGRKRLGLVDGRTEIASRPAVVADRPMLVRPLAPAGLPLVLEHVLAWRAGDAVASARDYPVTIECPFSMRGRISASFLYRSDAPYFFAVSIGGVVAGVLSAPDDPFGGRGVEIWSASDLEKPDKAFDKDERHRTANLAKHPEALKKEGDKRFFCFEPGRTYRVEFVKDERKASLFVDGVLRCDAEWRPVGGPLEGKITLASFGAGEVDDLRITGILER